MERADVIAGLSSSNNRTYTESVWNEIYLIILSPMTTTTKELQLISELTMRTFHDETRKAIVRFVNDLNSTQLELYTPQTVVRDLCRESFHPAAVKSELKRLRRILK